MRYKRAPIVEAALEFRWMPERPLDAMREVADLEIFSDFGEPKKRTLVKATIDVQGGELSHEGREVGYGLSQKDGSQAVMLDVGRFMFVQRAPYDRWQVFSQRALGLLAPVASQLDVNEFSRIGVRFINRLDIPIPDDGKIDTDDYITIRFDGPKRDTKVIHEFMMRVVKPSATDGLAYALEVATAASPLRDHASITLDIDVFTRQPTPASGPAFDEMLARMREEKNDIFQSCLQPKAIDLFGGVEE